MNTVRFNQALGKACDFLRDSPIIRESGADQFVLIRDLYGRLRLLCPTMDAAKKADLTTAWIRAIGSSADLARPLWSDCDFFDASALRCHPQLQRLTIGGGATDVPFLERGVIGADWLETSFSEHALRAGEKTPKRIVFYGLKGGVGRSTALCVAARHFAKKGLKVLVLDMDLESPGLSGLMLPSGRLPGYGIADWFVEDALDQADGTLLENMVADSPLASDWPGIVRVVPALGREESDYIPKLARIYAELNHAGNGDAKRESFPDRFFRMLTALEQQERPDIVLLDSRAGLHDIAATLLVRVPDALRLLFATHSPQTWLGYRQLFQHWQLFPAHLPLFRDGLQIVDALMPETGKTEHLQSFLQSAYTLFSETLYETAAPGVDETTVFNFSESDTDAPHAAAVIAWDRKFMEFDPNDSSSPFHTDELIQSCYGSFLGCLDERLPIDEPTSP